MNKVEIAEHLSLKKKISHYPSLPKFITHSSEKKYIGYDKGLKESCIRGFRKRLSNWLRDPNNKVLIPVVQIAEPAEEGILESL